jgi:inner membrane protein
MFNSTHTLVGLAIARTGLGKWAPRATWAAIIASNLPDIDIVTQFAGTAAYLDHHRGITHTVLGTPLLAFALAAVMAAGNWSTLWRYFFVSLIAMATHPLLDFANTYGVRPYLPFTTRWYYGDTLFIMDPWLDLILLIGIILSYKVARRAGGIAAATLIVALAYIGGMVALHSIAARTFETFVTGRTGVVECAVGPEFLNPLEWTGYIATTTDVSNYRIGLRTGEVRPDSRLLTDPPSKIIEAAEATYSARVLRSFARFPVTRVRPTSSGYRVQFIDFRFYRASAKTALLAEILLNPDLSVMQESMSFVGSVAENDN